MGGLTEHVRLVLRISCRDFDALIDELAEAGRDDLVASGLRASAARPEGGDPDLAPLVRQALACYVAAHFDRDDEAESRRWWAAYERLRVRLAMDSRYAGGGGDEVG